MSAAERAHALLPDDLTIETNWAHALMFLGCEEESKPRFRTGASYSNRASRFGGEGMKLSAVPEPLACPFLLWRTGRGQPYLGRGGGVFAFCTLIAVNPKPPGARVVPLT